MSDRLYCCVPFCNRTKKLEPLAVRFDPPEWICSDHWRAVPRPERAIYTRALRKAGGKGTPATARLWARMKRIAIEKAGGI